MFKFLSGFRGIAAIAVVYTHCMDLVQPSHATAITIFDPYNDAWHHIGEQAVIAFFVLSSFLLTWRFLDGWHRVKQQRIQNPTLSYRWEAYEFVKYLIRRFFRIYPSYFILVVLISQSSWLQEVYEWDPASVSNLISY
jgi:peptidoglycan/LPS O-acetylase OafA/YrhL